MISTAATTVCNLFVVLGGDNPRISNTPYVLKLPSNYIS